MQLTRIWAGNMLLINVARLHKLRSYETVNKNQAVLETRITALGLPDLTKESRSCKLRHEFPTFST